uniref:Uncharacterized protein n=1 Tax=Tetranychus urticae TaxID=32264 RepID=T1JZD2_TETUR
MALISTPCEPIGFTGISVEG